MALRHLVKIILTITVLLVVAGTIIVEFGAQTIIQLYLGASFLPMAPILQIIMLAAIPFAVYVTMKSVIDAFYVTMVNAMNMFISFMFFLAGTIIIFALSHSTTYALFAFVLGIYVLAILTILRVRTIYYTPEATITTAS